MSIAEKLQTVAENQQKVYDAGKQAEYDAFWDGYLKHGVSGGLSGSYLFYGSRWDKNLFRPNQDLIPQSATSMFESFNMPTTREPIDLVDVCNQLGITIDFSKSSSLTKCFYNSNISRIGKIVLMASSSLGTSTFANSSRIETIDEIVFVSSGHTSNITGTFSNCTGLKNIKFSGGKLKCTINLQWCPLTVESMKSVISSLVDCYEAQISPNSYGVYFSDECWAALEADSTSPTGSTWKEYVNQYLLWKV